MRLHSEKDKAYARIARLEEQVKQLLQTVGKQQTEIVRLNLQWSRTFKEDASAWIKKEELVNILVAKGLLGLVESRKSGTKRDNVRFFTDKVRRDNTFEIYEGEGRPPIGSCAWKQGTRIMYHRLNAVEQFKKFYGIEIL